MTNDGRYIDPRLGALSGEGSQQRVRAGEERLDQLAREAWDHVPSSPPQGGATYYDRPLLKEPVWKWYVPAYFYAGGAAGASAVLGAIAQAVGGEEMRGLVKRARWVSALGCASGTVLLVLDLGRRERFLNMLRVFRPTSPMSVGSFVLAAAGPLTAVAALLAEADGDGALGVLGDAAGYAAGAAGLPLSGYTAVLVSNSAIPIWQEVRRSLPALFVSSAVSSAASLLDVTSLSPKERSAVHRFGVAGKAAELVAMRAVERDASRVERVGRPLREGFSGTLWRASKAATAAGLALTLLPGKHAWKRTAAAALGTAGALGIRMAIFYAGVASARDPRATFEHQRAGHGASEVTASSDAATRVPS